MVAKGESLCKGKSVKAPNRCKKVQGCKVAKGTKRAFCRKAHNKTTKRQKRSATRRRLAREHKKLS
jgi:hypothetical protein